MYSCNSDSDVYYHMDNNMEESFTCNSNSIEGCYMEFSRNCSLESDNCYRNSRYHQMAKGNLFDNNSNTEFDVEDRNDEILSEFLLRDKISELEKTYFENFFQHLRGRPFIRSTIFFSDFSSVSYSVCKILSNV